MQIKIKLTPAEFAVVDDVKNCNWGGKFPNKVLTKLINHDLVEPKYTGPRLVLTRLGALAWEQNQPKVEKSKDPVYPLCVDYWLKQFHPGFLFGGVQGKALQSLINKIRSISTNPTDETVVATFQKLCQRLPEWYKDKDLPVIDSKFNEIVAEIQKGPVRGYNQMNSAERLFFGTE